MDINLFFEEFDYPKEARIELERVADSIHANAEANMIFCEIIDTYRKNWDGDYKYIPEATMKISEIIGEEFYTVDLLAYIYMSEPLRELYKAKGIGDDIWKNTMLDLKYKLLECHDVKHVWGTFVGRWFDGFFNLTRFAFGRLQFEVLPLEHEYSRNGKTLTASSPVIYVHIPRTFTPIDEKSCDEAYAMAKEFFKDKFDSEQVPFACHSWLLYPANFDIVSEKSNIYRFISEFDIFYSKDDKDDSRPEMWRLFDMDYTGDVNDYPENTSLRKRYKEYMLQGGKTGEGLGVFFR